MTVLFQSYIIWEENNKQTLSNVQKTRVKARNQQKIPLHYIHYLQNMCEITLKIHTQELIH